ncbi:MAG TPA: type I glyceraldehyde-3-phosphate dehydrogenase [bacterium]|nr:type I glyceraldehyde-3-phosphate dehydrogenase [bacterium]
MGVKVGINGFGRIGRCFVRIAFGSDVEVVGINDIVDAKTLAHLLKYDSVHRTWDQDVKAEGDAIVIAGKKIKVTAIKEPDKLPWKDLGVDVAIESTGLFRTRSKAELHLKAGAKKVIISAPGDSKDPPDLTVVIGINDKLIDKAKHHIVSNGSCTTNCLAPVAKVLNDNFKIKHGLMTTIHSYTNDQRILDLPHKDLRRARAAALSMIPSSTGAAKAIGLVLPELNGKLSGLSIRVPTPNVSLVDLVTEVEKGTTVEEVNAALKKAAEGELKGILAYTEEELVSSDFMQTAVSSTVDAKNTFVVDKTMVKVLAWYDNEWGFSNRMVDLVRKMA